MVRKLIAERIVDLGLNMAEVSRRLHRNETYLQQYLKKGSPRELPERERIMLSQILAVPEDSLRGASLPLPSRNYGKNMETRKSPVADTVHAPYTGVAEQRILQGTDVVGSIVDLPVFGTSFGGNGEIMLSKVAVDWVVRPPMLSRVQDAYAVIVPRNKMEPVVRMGSIVMFHPHLPPRVGDLCLFRRIQDGDTYVLGAEYRSETETSWKVRHYNPAEDFSLKKSEWIACHRAVGAYYP